MALLTRPARTDRAFVAPPATPPPGLPAPGPAYLPELDVLRGAAIIGVVYLHAYFSPWPETPHSQLLLLNALHLLAHTAVPLFLFVSGFLFGRARPAPLREYAARRLHRVLVPALAWMVAAAVYRLWILDAPLHEVVRAFLLFDASGQFYFIPVLVLLTLVFAWFMQRSPSLATLHRVAVVAFAVNLLAIAFYEYQTLDGDMALFAYRNPLVWCFCYAFGVYAGRVQPTLGWTRRWLAPVLAAMAAVAAAHFWQGERGAGYPVSYFGITVFLFSSLALVAFPGLVALLRGSAIARAAMEPLRRLGPYSYAIFLVHMPFFLGWLTTETVSGGRFADDYFQLMHALFAAGLVSTIAFVLLANRLWPWFGRTLLGVEPWRRQVLPRREDQAGAGESR